MANIQIVNGPNLNLLGQREPHIYGAQTLDQVIQSLSELGQDLGHCITHMQSNAETELINAIHAASGRIDFILINPAAYGHTSIALRDALLAVAIPYIEVHISNVFAREPFRHTSFLADKAVGVITGLGCYGYELALQAAHHHLQHHQHTAE